MNDLFGLPISTIAIVLGGLLGVAVITVGILGMANPTMMKFGLRNIPRRGLQSLLVIVGLALAELDDATLRDLGAPVPPRTGASRDAEARRALRRTIDRCTW